MFSSGQYQDVWMISGGVLVCSDALTVSGSSDRSRKRIRLMFVFLNRFFEHLNRNSLNSYEKTTSYDKSEKAPYLGAFSFDGRYH